MGLVVRRVLRRGLGSDMPLPSCLAKELTNPLRMWAKTSHWQAVAGEDGDEVDRVERREEDGEEDAAREQRRVDDSVVRAAAYTLHRTTRAPSSAGARWPRSKPLCL